MDTTFQENITEIKSKKMCKQCVMLENKPHIWFNENGICNVCIEYAQIKDANEETITLETEFIKMLNLYRSYGKYDCLVMCSGGKDSTAALYYMKRRYK